MRAALLCGAAFVLAFSAAAAASSHSPEFWRDIRAHGFSLPQGTSPFELIRELTARYLGAPDPELRDDLAYEISAAWIYRDQRLGDAELKELLLSWRANLKVKIGETSTDSVLLRSFSALDLSLLAALDLKRPFLRQAEFDALLGSALDYLAAERDLRGFEPRVGWIHATAHTADLLKFLGRNDKLQAGEQERILSAIAAKLEAVHEPFTHGEAERLARSVLSLALRPDAQAPALEAFVATLRAREEAMWRKSTRPEPGSYAAAQNGHELLKSLCVLLDQQTTPSSVAHDLRARLLAALP